MEKAAIQALTELLNSRSEWVRTRARIINQDSIEKERIRAKSRIANEQVINDSDNFYSDVEERRGWSGDYYAHHD